MKSDQIAARWRVWILALAIGVFVLPEGIALAIPKDPPPKPEIQTPDSGELRVARRRRRRRRRPTRRRRRRTRPRPTPRPAPEPAAAATPDSDLSNNTAKGGSNVDPGALRRGGRVEFDGRLVQGQTAKSGAIYLFARKRSELKSMVEERTNYRKEILRTVDTKWSKEAK
jgi:hypothetical protein